MIQHEVTRVVKLKWGTKQTATKVNGLSSVKDEIIEADIFGGMEGTTVES
ncbi:hypothetical protein REIS_1589 [Rickettsia endosymbiont of Ixodes scapularis]|nr:hypothetical protein REIS_1589 [Rickettsia endosymbiont of Ixodes scapularis]